MCVNGVCLICGRYLDTTGNEYKPTVEATNIYKIITISNPAPNGPNFDSELTPKVNCLKKNYITYYSYILHHFNMQLGLLIFYSFTNCFR